MCKHGETETVRVRIPADLSHNGQERWAYKPVDRCISLLVAELNDAGIYTQSSCCGHGKATGWIELHDGTILVTKVAGAPHDD